jgi:hypothetical protein
VILIGFELIWSSVNRPVLLGLSLKDLQSQEKTESFDQQPHPDEHQVHLDTKRSFVHYPRDLSKGEKERIQGELDDLIVGVLRKYPGLGYFQVSEDVQRHVCTPNNSMSHLAGIP